MESAVETLVPILREIWPWGVSVAYVFVAVWAAGHAIIHKRDVRAAIGWTGLILFSPFVGATAYYFFGINRLRRRAVKLASAKNANAKPTERFAESLVQPRFGEPFDRLNHAVARTTGQPLLAGNSAGRSSDTRPPNSGLRPFSRYGSTSTGDWARRIH